MADPLACVEDVETRIGRPLTSIDERRRIEALLRDASAAVRLYTGRHFGASTVTARLRVWKDGAVHLPRGVTAVTGVADINGNSVGHTWDGLERVYVGLPYRFDAEIVDLPSAEVVDVTYTTGSATVPDAIVAVVAQMAARAFGTPADQSGHQQESIAGYSYSVGVAAAAGGVGMLPGEKEILDRFKRVGGVVRMNLR
jgi:hypothetical protein